MKKVLSPISDTNMREPACTKDESARAVGAAWAEDGASTAGEADTADMSDVASSAVQVITDAAAFAPPVVDVLVRITHPVGDLAGGKQYKNALWDDIFKEHHYMSAELPVTATCAVARWGARPVGFVAVLPQPGVHEAGLSYEESRTVRRESRLVVLPEFQGLGIGPRLSNATGSRWVGLGNRYISRTAHPRFGACARQAIEHLSLHRCTKAVRTPHTLRLCHRHRSRGFGALGCDDEQ